MSMHAPTRTARAVPAAVVDDVFELYVHWRQACADARADYERWRRADREDRRLAFAAFGAALEREDCAARVYAASLARSLP